MSITLGMDDLFTIHVDRLKSGRPFDIDCEIQPDFIGVREAELVFTAPVCLKGEAYLADTTLIVHLDIRTKATMPCAICNQDVQVALHLPDFYHTEELTSIQGGTFYFGDVVREAILLELPLKAECEGGCKQRQMVAKYFVSKEHYHPFKDL